MSTKNAPRSHVAATSITKLMMENFIRKCEENNTTRAAVIADFIEQYTYNGFTMPERLEVNDPEDVDYGLESK